MFYRDVVGLEFAFGLPERHAAFLWVGGRGHGMLGFWSGGLSPHAMRLQAVGWSQPGEVPSPGRRAPSPDPEPPIADIAAPQALVKRPPE